ncbi:MAG: hypothetical protein JWN34_30 [Bryobacterales bacterium]|nr:hypothetical protein [Bryobacterales bacterium]
MATTQAELDNLIRIRNTGARIVEFDGKKTEFRSLQDMDRTIDSMKADLGQSRRSRHSLTGFTKDSSLPTRTTVDPYYTNS